MSKLRSIILCVLVFLCTSQGFGLANQTQLWEGLEPGPFAVGFKETRLYDNTRTFQEGKSARPIPISIWYPGIAPEKEAPILYQEYVLSELTKTDFTLLDPRAKEKILDGYKAVLIKQGVKNENINALLMRSTLAFRDLKCAPGRFPIIIYGPGGKCPSHDNSVLCELLASNGYVVGASPSTGAYSKDMTFGIQGVETQTRDLEFVYSHLKSFPNGDPSKVGTAGFSFGGFNNFILAKRNHNIKAIVSFDGAIFNKTITPFLNRTPVAYTKDLLIPLLCVASGGRRQLDMTFFENLKYSDAWLFLFNGAAHMEFSSNIFLNTTILLDRDLENNRTLKQAQENYAAACLYTLNFFNGVLKNKEEGFAYLNRTPKENGFVENIVTCEIKKALPVPPSEEKFYRVIEKEGIDAGLLIANQTLDQNPDSLRYDETRLNNTGYEYLQSKRIKEAIGLFRLNVRLHSQSANVYDSLGEAHMANGEIKVAIRNYQKSLELNPGNENAKTMLKKLQHMDG